MTSRLTVIQDLIDGFAVRGWNEAEVPLEKRGISRIWLTEFISRIQAEINAGVAAPYSFENPGLAPSERADHRVDRRPFQVLNTHALVKHIIKPATVAVRAPLYAFVPERHRGTPQTFVSHTWSSLLMGAKRQSIGTLDALNCNKQDDEFVWIDFICYNQHLFESIAVDMARVAATIGSLSVVATPMPLYRRSWCLWELLCACRADLSVDVRVHFGWRNDKILSVNSLYRSFEGVARAQSSSPLDQEDIYKAFLEVYGSAAEADKAILDLIETKFADPLFELQEPNRAMEFSSLPYAWGERDAASGGVPFFLPDLLNARLYAEKFNVRDLMRQHNVLPKGENHSANYDSRQVDESHSSAAVSAANVELRAQGESGQVEARTLDVKIVTNGVRGKRPTANVTKIRMNCTRCGTSLDITSRPLYIQSSDANSLWRRFLQGTRANTCECGLVFSGGPAMFQAETWTAFTLEPPSGVVLPAIRYAALVSGLLEDRGGKYPLLVFEREEDISVSLRASGDSQFAAMPYTTLMFGDYAEVRSSLNEAACAAAGSGHIDLAYSILRSACLTSLELFVVFETEMAEFAELWDRSGLQTPLSNHPLMVDFAAVKQASEKCGIPDLRFGATYFCVPEVQENVNGSHSLETEGMMMAFGGDGELRTAGRIGRIWLPRSMVPPPEVSTLLKRKLDVTMLAARDYVENSTFEVNNELAEAFEVVRIRLSAYRQKTLPKDWGQLENVYQSFGFVGLDGAIG